MYHSIQGNEVIFLLYQGQALMDKINELRHHRESELSERKEANVKFSFNDIGKYFSALSNEANLRGLRESWLLFGVADDGSMCGTSYREGGDLQALKKEVANQTNQRLTFLEIYEVILEGKRVIAFQIPPALQGIPTTWNNASYAREGSSLCPLPLNKVDLIRGQSGIDWSKEIVAGASIDDLDPVALQLARDLFQKHQRSDTTDVAESLSDIAFLNKIGVTIQGQITTTALVLLGKQESGHFFDGFVPRITWTLYNADGSAKAYEHFNMPLLLAVDKVYGKIRNEKYRYIAEQQTLFPNEVDQYVPELMKELLNNCLAHQDYRLRGKINVGEYEDRVVFMNEGNFIPETIERAIAPGYKAPYYRNRFLCDAMINLYMIDTNSMGIPRMYKIQRDRYFPLPTYDLSQPNRIIVTIYGKILDSNYTRLLCTNETLDLGTVFLLDKIQKRAPISKEDYQVLKKRGLVEGRYPNIYVSFKVADIVGETAKYVKNRGLTDEACIQYILNALEQMGSASKRELVDLISELLPQIFNNEQKSRKTSYLLEKMKKNGMIISEGHANKARWRLANR